MADFAPNVTFRYRLKYRAVARTHTVMVRAARGTLASPGAAQCATYIRAVFSALAAMLPADLAFISADYSLTDSDLFFPAAVPAAVTGANALTLYSKQDSITHCTFSGRGALGSKVSVKIYGVALNPDALPVNIASDFLILSSEQVEIANAIAALNTGSGVIVAIDNSVPAYYAQATVKVNDYWLKKVRQGL